MIRSESKRSPHMMLISWETVLLTYMTVDSNMLSRLILWSCGISS